MRMQQLLWGIALRRSLILAIVGYGAAGIVNHYELGSLAFWTILVLTSIGIFAEVLHSLKGHRMRTGGFRP